MIIGLVLTEIQRYVQISKGNVWHPDAVSDSVRMAIHFFVNFDIFKWLYLAYFWVYSQQTWGFCKAWYALYDRSHGLLLYDYVDQ